LTVFKAGRELTRSCLGADIANDARIAWIGDEILPHERDVRGWLRRFGRDAEAIRAHFSRWAFALDVQLGPVAPAGGAFADALAVIGVAARAFVLRFGPGEAWPIAARLSGGGLLCHTSCPFPRVP